MDELPKLPNARWSCDIPKGSGACVAMCEFKGKVIIACQFAVYEYDGAQPQEQKLRPVLSVPTKWVP